MKPAVHVLLESVPETLGKQASQESREAAATLFNQCCQQGLARIAVKVWMDRADVIDSRTLLQQNRHGHCTLL